MYNIPINKLHQEASENLNLYATNPDGAYVFNSNTPIIGELLEAAPANNPFGSPPTQGGQTYGVDTNVTDGSIGGGNVYRLTLKELEPIVRQALIEYGGDPTSGQAEAGGFDLRAFRINGLQVYDFVDFEEAGDSGGGIVFGEDGDGILG